MTTLRSTQLAAILLASATLSAQQATMQNHYLALMEKAAAHASQHGAKVPPVLSPLDRTVLPNASGDALVPIKDLQAKGIRVIPWTTNDPEAMRTIIRLGVDGLISDRPDLLQQVLKEERAARPGDPRLQHFDVSAHRGGRGLRPENTLPSFESGLDQLATTLETDTGVSTDQVSTIWHDQFYNPQSCRKADGSEYTLQNRIYLRDISSTDAQKTFICDKLHFGADQKNDLALSPVSVAFAKAEHLQNPYVPTNVPQLFRFVDFYVRYYRKGAGSSDPHAVERAANAAHVRFNIETKIMPENLPAPAAGSPESKIPAEFRQNHTVTPQVFVQVLAGIIASSHLESRCEIQSFDYRTLILVEEQFPHIPTYYLSESPRSLSSELVPASLRQPAQ